MKIGRMMFVGINGHYLLSAPKFANFTQKPPLIPITLHCVCVQKLWEL